MKNNEMAVNSDLMEARNWLSGKLFGETISGGIAKNICISCKQLITVNIGNDTHAPGNIYSEEGLSEYRVSGLCETCFDNSCECEDEEYE